MPSRRAHDPYAPHEEDLMAEADFREDRWRRAGATAEELDVLRNEHEVRALNEQLAEAANIDSVADDDLRQELSARRDAGPLVDQSIPTILDRVGDDQRAARAVLEVERRRERPRSTLIDKLERIVLAGADTSGGGTGGDAEASAVAGQSTSGGPFPQRGRPATEAGDAPGT